jgi:hypothetical protein
VTIIPLALPVGSNISIDGQVSNSRIVNGYAEEVGQDGKSAYAIFASPGQTRFDTGSYTGAVRGLIELNSNALIAFLGNEVASIDQGGTPTTLGTLVGSGLLSLARNRATSPQIGIITGSGQYYLLAGGTISLIADADLPTPNCIDYSDGVFLYGIADGRIYASDLEDGTNIQGDAFGTARSDSSDLRRVKAHAGFVYVFKAEGAEIWKADPSLAEENFFFSPVQQNIDIGCLAPHSVASLARGLAWVDNNGVVRFGRDGNAQRISNHSVERSIEDLTYAQRGAIAATVHTFSGHEVYTISSDAWTWQYDVLRQRWDPRETYGEARWQVSCCEQFNGSYVVGNINDGKLFRIDPAANTEGDDLLVMQIWFPHSHRFPNGMKVSDFYLDAIKGVGVTGPDLHASNPEIMLDYSDDGGHTFEGEQSASLGEVGNRTERLRFGRFGAVRENGRIWRVSVSAPVKRGIIQAALDATPLK